VFNVKNVFYATEETADYCDTTQIMPNHQRLIRWGRGEGIAVVSVTQRCASIHKDIIANSTHAFLFRTNITPDKIWLRGWLPAEAVDAIESLDNFEFVYVNQLSGDWYIHAPIGETATSEPEEEEEKIDDSDRDTDI